MEDRTDKNKAEESLTSETRKPVLAVESYGKEIPDKDKAVAGPLVQQFSNLCLLRGSYDGRPSTFVCVAEESDGDVELQPIMMILSVDDLDRCRDTFGNQLTEIDEAREGKDEGEGGDAEGEGTEGDGQPGGDEAVEGG